MIVQSVPISDDNC